MVTNRVLVKRFKQGESVEAICERYGIAWARVTNALRLALPPISHPAIVNERNAQP